ncbi:Competence protein F -like protein, phosphoribosyltransferase domain protein [Lunatimonas lonarensis]|uniref:Competence protein F-like protein, phosphoribosyltransferase domain protein n=1 Tax=Lunatimonas lonarensis TaxID=1232681 RepID=R7ZNN3_9BACT|nr:ComF family protein [Lunatimonas lonarensis]EON75720.1 Competence protein F -like protein, phosphoribosyltransferase domain protein [Lunatimonas lonarensis]
MRFNLWEDFLALLFPVTCDLCNRSLYAFEEHVCRVCEASLPISSYHQSPGENELKQKIVGLAEVRYALSYLRFSKRGKSQKLLHQLKYRNKPGLGVKLGKLYATLLRDQGFQDEWDLIIPVPLHLHKQRRRGYNQSRCFAEGLGDLMGIPVENLLTRTVNTSTQTRKTRFQRWENVSDVFLLVDKESLLGKKVLLVDDVMTTGATLAACAQRLLEGKPRYVDIAVIAAGT